MMFSRKLSTVFAFAGFCFMASMPALAEDSSEKTITANDNCVNQNLLAKTPKAYGELGKIYQLSSRHPLGDFLMKPTSNQPFEVCLLDNAQEEIAFVEDQKIFLNPGNEGLATIDDEQKRRAFIALVALEEYAHAQAQRTREAGSYRKSKMVEYRLSDAISATFIDESVAASAAVLVAFQQHEDGQSELWDVLKEDWNPYKYIALAIEEKAKETNDIATLHLEGAKIWMRTPFFTARYAGQTIGSYKWHFDKDYEPQKKPAGLRDLQVNDLRSYGTLFDGDNIFKSTSNEELQAMVGSALNLAIQKAGPRLLFSLKRTEQKIDRYNRALPQQSNSALKLSR